MPKAEGGLPVGPIWSSPADPPLSLCDISPRKGGEGNRRICISLLQGELPKAEGVPLPIDNAVNHPYGWSLPHVNENLGPASHINRDTRDEVGV